MWLLEIFILLLVSSAVLHTSLDVICKRGSELPVSQCKEGIIKCTGEIT